MIEVDCIVHGDYLLPMDPGCGVIKSGAMAVRDGVIVDVSDYETIAQRYKSKKLIGGEDRAVMPGFINTHTHAAMVLLRGLADDMPLKEWLEGHVWPAENKWLSPEFINDAMELACLEMLKSGTTTYCDMYFFEDVAAGVVKKLGMRAVLGAGVVDFPTKTTQNADDCIWNAEELILAYENDKLITPSIAAHSAYACSPETLKKIRNLALRHNALVQIHLSEAEWEVHDSVSKHGARPAWHLDRIGLFDCRTIAAHCVWLDDGEIELLKNKNVGVSHCIESNLKLASGIAPVPKMLKAGINVSLGTDGAASNNDLNIISDMSTAAKVHKAASNDPTAVDAKTALLMATRWGAEAMGLKHIGSLEAGKAADAIVINLDKPHMTPLYNIVSHMVYCMRPDDIETVMVNGSVLVENGRLACADEGEILEKSRAWSKKIRSI